MKYSHRHSAYWLLLAFLLAALPLGIALLGPLPEPEGFWFEFAVGLGFVGMGLMVVQFLTSGRFARVAARFGPDMVLKFHARLGILAVVLVLAHPAILLVTRPDLLEYYDPRVNVLRALALSFATVALVALLVTSQWRTPLGIRYETWRLLHGVLALGVVFVGMVHGLQVGRYLDTLLKQGLWVGLCAGAMATVLHVRVIRPWRARRRPWRIARVDRERGDAWSLWLEPEGHDGMTYRAGQYVWITVGDPPHQLQQHPFSFSSVEDPRRIRLTAAAAGDFTRTWPEFEPGTPVYLEGPFGSFTAEPDAPGLVFIVGGIGVTPALSILHTLRADGDRRPLFLFYGNPTLEDVTFAEEIRDLEADLDLTVIHVLQEPPDGWTGETGYVDRAMLDRRLPPERRTFHVHLCGPPPMMDAVEQALLDLGVPWNAIYSERFDIV